jgi:tetratricopeptide (TPR) repeat protein
VGFLFISLAHIHMADFKAGKRPFKFKPWLGLRRIAPFQTEHNADGEKIRVFWFRLLLWIVSLALVTWLGVTGAAYFFIKYKREYSAVKYEHLFFYPWKKDDYRHARCRFLLELGKTQLADKKYMEAFNNIRLGLLEVPEDTEARINIAQFYIALKRYDLAEKTLAEGLEFNIEKHDYVMAYFRFLFGQQRDDRAIEISRQIRASNPKNAGVVHTLIMAEASAHYFRGRYAKALATIKGEVAVGAPDSVLLSAQIKWQIGEKEKALGILADLSTRDIKESAEIYRIRVEYLKELGRLSDVRRIAILRQVEHPEDPTGYLDEITTCDPVTESVRLAGAIAEVFNRFPDSAPAMNGLAQIAASTGQVDLAWRVIGNARPRTCLGCLAPQL